MAGTTATAATATAATAEAAAATASTTEIIMQIAAITAAAMSATGAVIEGINAEAQGNFAKQEAKINKELSLQAQKQAYQEESLNATQRYRAGRHDLAEGTNMMSAMGNIGTSAQSALFEGAFNLSEDLSALRYKYDAEAAKHGTQANMYGKNAEMADYNRKMGVLASSIKTTGAIASGVTSYGKLMGWGASSATQ